MAGPAPTVEHNGKVIEVGPLLAVIERLGLSELIFGICTKNGVLIEVMLAGVRTKSACRARAECCYELRKRLLMSHPEITKLLGMHDHTGSIHLIRRHERRLKQEADNG